MFGASDSRNHFEFDGDGRATKNEVPNCIKLVFKSAAVGPSSSAKTGVAAESTKARNHTFMAQPSRIK